MRVLLAVVLVGVVECGGGDNSPGDVAVPTPKSSQAKTDKSPAQTANADPVAALETIGAKIKRNEQGEVVEVSMGGYESQITDAGLVYLKGLQLTSLVIPNDAKTDLGLKHYLAALEAHTDLNLNGWKITDAGVAELQKSLPNCKIAK